MNRISLGETAKFINGRAFRPDEWTTHGLPIIRIQNLTGSSETVNYYDGEVERKYLVKKGDILISWSASLGVYIWKGDDAVLNQHIFRVEVEDNVDKNYFYYAATVALREMLAKVHGATMQHITKDPFESTLIALPPLPEQQRIAAILEKADGLRRQRRYARQLSETFLQAVFLRMFGDPATNPMGWDEVKLDELISIISGKSFKFSEYSRDGVRLLQIANVTFQETNWDTIAYLPTNYIDAYPKLVLEAGDLVMALNRPILGNRLKFTILSKKDCPAILYQRVGGSTPLKGGGVGK